MSLNNQLYKIFNDLTKAYKENNYGSIEQAARCWMQLTSENPFIYDTPEYEEFFQMHRCYEIWAKGAIDQKINKRRMVQHAKALCALNPKCPYVYDKKAEEEEKRAKQEYIESLKPVKIIPEEPKVVLNVVPEDKKNWLSSAISKIKRAKKNDG